MHKLLLDVRFALSKFIQCIFEITAVELSVFVQQILSTLIEKVITVLYLNILLHIIYCFSFSIDMLQTKNIILAIFMIKLSCKRHKQID